MNEEQLETAARRYCELMGIDPELIVSYDNGTTMFTQRPQWQNVADRIRDHWALNEAILHVTRINLSGPRITGIKDGFVVME